MSIQFPQISQWLSNFRITPVSTIQFPQFYSYTDCMMENHPEPIAQIHIDTDECAQLNGLSKLNGWETDYRQAGGGKFSTYFSLYSSTGIRFSEQYCNREMMISAVPPPQHAALFLPLNSGDKGVMQGNSLGECAAALIGPESETFYRTPEGLHMMVATIPVSRLNHALRSATEGKSHQLSAKTRVFTLAEDTISRLSSRMSRALQITQTATDQAEVNVYLQEIEQDVVSTLSLALTHAEQPERGARGRMNRLRSLRRARDCIEANLASPLGMETLCKAASASQRTLEVAFRETLNITVVQYVKNRRLIAINRLLHDSHYTETSVSTLARAHGFNHMGHFARDYRALFDELPSDTLRRQRG
jgi:AraC-like DNA-binding protein